MEIVNYTIEQVTSFMENTVDDICKDLDIEINKLLANINDLSDKELMSLIIKLPMLIFDVSVKMEKLGTQTDVAKTVSQNRYSNTFAHLSKGTVEHKRAVANKEIEQINIHTVGYKRAYKAVESKIKSAYELINSAKKVLSIRENERNLLNENNK